MHPIVLCGDVIVQIKMFAEDWVVYPRTSGSPEPTWHEARSAEAQMGSGDPRGLGYPTKPSTNILTIIIAHVLQLIYNILGVSAPKTPQRQGPVSGPGLTASQLLQAMTSQ